MKRYRKIWIPVLLLIISIFLIWSFLPQFATDISKQDLNINQLGDRILYFAPHPDDEVLGGGGMIQKAIESGKQVTVVLMTTGDGFADDAKVVFHSITTTPAHLRKLAIIRHEETIHALESLGVKRKNIIFLGYPDGGMDKLWGNHWSCQTSYIALNGYTYSPYSFSYQKDVKYCGENVLTNVKNIIQQVHPTAVIYPDPNDQHPDHWATGAFVDQALMEKDLHVMKLYYLVHADHFLWPFKHSDKPPEYLKINGAQFLFLSLSKAEQQRKRDAIFHYPTQLKVMGPWMEQFVRDKDVFEIYPEPKLIYNPQPKLEDLNPLFREKLTSLLSPPGSHLTDIDGIYNNKQLDVGFGTAGKILPANTYQVNLRLFKPKRVDFLQLSIHEGKVSVSSFNGSVPNIHPVLKQSSHQAWLILPRDVLNQVQHLFVSVDVINHGQRLEHSPWHFIRVN